MHLPVNLKILYLKRQITSAIYISPGQYMVNKNLLSRYDHRALDNAGMLAFS